MNGGTNQSANPEFFVIVFSVDCIDIVRQKINNGFDLNDPTESLHLLSVACGLDKIDLVKFLISYGADIRIDNDGPIIRAITSGNLEMLKLLWTEGQYDISQFYNIRMNNQIMCITDGVNDSDNQILDSCYLIDSHVSKYGYGKINYMDSILLIFIIINRYDNIFVFLESYGLEMELYDDILLYIVYFLQENTDNNLYWKKTIELLERQIFTQESIQMAFVLGSFWRTDDSIHILIKYIDTSSYQLFIEKNMIGVLRNKYYNHAQIRMITTFPSLTTKSKNHCIPVSKCCVRERSANSGYHLSISA